MCFKGSNCKQSYIFRQLTGYYPLCYAWNSKAMMVELFFCIAQIILIANCEYWGTPEIVYLHDIAKKEEIIFQNVLILIPSPPQPFECTVAQMEAAIVITRG